MTQLFSKSCLFIVFLLSLCGCLEQRHNSPSSAPLAGPTGDPSRNLDYWKRLEQAITLASSHKVSDISESIEQIRRASVVNVDPTLALHALEVASLLEAIDRTGVAEPAFSFGGLAGEGASSVGASTDVSGLESIPVIVQDDANSELRAGAGPSLERVEPVESGISDRSENSNRESVARAKLEDWCDQVNRHSDHIRVFLSKDSAIDYATLPRLKVPPTKAERNR